jgi:hypothetical protein
VPRGPERQWRRQREPLLDTHIAASIAGGQDPATLHYAELTEDEINGQAIRDAEVARELKAALYRAARRRQVSLSATVERKADGTYQVRFKAIDKAAGRAYMISRYGPDRSKWPYNPRTPNAPKEGQ